jgi:hypothetical protein
MKRSFLAAVFVCAVPAYLYGAVYSDDFSGDLSQWTAGPSHLDSYAIVGGELFMDGYGHLTGPGGWGVLQFNQSLGSNFVATWDARITYYDYANFTLAADPPWAFDVPLGYTNNGYVAWLDSDDPFNPLLDVVKFSGGGLPLDLPTPQRNISVTPDIANNQWFSWKVEMDSGQLSVYIDDKLYIDTFDPEFANSNYKIGLSFGEDSQGFIDNFQVSVVPVPTAVLLGMLGLGIAGVKLRKYA